MNFQKVRKKKVDGHTARSWERGFLSAECGTFAYILHCLFVQHCMLHLSCLNLMASKHRIIRKKFHFLINLLFVKHQLGDMAPDDIGYLPLYKPDIEGMYIMYILCVKKSLNNTVNKVRLV